MSDLIRVEPLLQGVAGIALARAGRRNALSVDLLDQLCAAVDSLAADDGQRVAILYGEGPLFSAGLDLREAADDSLGGRPAAAIQRALLKLRQTSLVTVAAVHGGAYAGGAGVMAACDIVVAAEDTKIGFPEARRGLVPALICNVLRTKVRDGDLRDLFLAGEPVDARRAQQMGLVQRVVSSDGLMEEALHVSRSVVSGGPETVRLTKRLLNEVLNPSEDATQPLLQEWHLKSRSTGEAREGLAAFLQKREPNWTQPPETSS